MITLSRVKQATDAFIKVLRFGKSDVQTSEQAEPFGLHSKPIKEMLAAHAKTTNDSESLIIGYITKITNETDEGETLVYSMDSSGTIKGTIFLKDDGTIEVNGNTDNLVKYTGLNTPLQTFVTNLNSKLSVAFTALGYTWMPELLNISTAKCNTIKAE